MNRNFWHNKNVLITGFEGFLGSNLTKRLVSYNANVIGLDIKVKRKNTILIKDIYRNIIVIKGNVTNYKLLRKIISRYKIEVIFHLAAEALVERCLKNPKRTFHTNICGTWNILETCRILNVVKAIVVASSDKAYGKHIKLPYKEDTPLCGNHPYDVSKSCEDLIANTYFHSYNLPVAITRCGNIYGPGDFNFSRIVPDTIKSTLENEKLFIRSDGKFTRDYIYVEDIVDGYILLAEKLQKLKLYGEAFNFSNETPISVLGLVKRIYMFANKEPNYKILNKAKCEIRHQFLSSNKAKEMLGWKPKYTFNEGLKKTIKWYEDYFLNESH